jgi:YhcG PDDEXK nuclease domain
VREPHKNPTISVLLCASKDDEVVECALSRSLSPALIAEYQMQRPDKRLLQQKLHEFYHESIRICGRWVQAGCKVSWRHDSSASPDAVRQAV